MIVGAGPAGLALAIESVARGLRPIVLEKRESNLDKACGEGLMPPGVRALRALGAELPPDHTVPFEGIRYVDGDCIAEGHFASGPGWGIRRTALSRALLARAEALGVQVRRGCALRGWRQRDDELTVETSHGLLRARTLAGADGLHSTVRRRAGLAAPRRRTAPLRWGLRRHFKIRPWSRFVEVHWSRNAEAYITPVGPETVAVAFLRSGSAAGFDEQFAGFPELARRLAGAPPVSEVRGATDFDQPVRRRYAGRVVLIGDAAGYVDALTGEGLTLAFHQASALAEVLAAGAPLAAYERRWRAITLNYRTLTRLMLGIATRNDLRHRVIGMLAAKPDLFDRLLAINAGELPLRALGASGALRALAGIAAAGQAGDASG